MDNVDSHIRVDKGDSFPVTQYSIWALTSGILPAWPKSNSYVWDHANAGTITIPLNYNLIVGGGRVVLFDTGWEDPKVLKYAGTVGWEPIILQLDRLGIKPDDVDTIVLSHMHLDHGGQTSHFPKATIFLQNAEMEFINAANRLPDERTKSRLLSYYLPADVEALRVAGREGRLVLVEGYCDLDLGLKIVPAINTHTAGCQMMLVNTAAGEMVLTGDTAYDRNNITKVIPMGTNMGSNFQCIMNFERILKLAGGKLERVVNPHDIDTFSYWPSWQMGDTQVAEIALAPGQRSLKPSQTP